MKVAAAQISCVPGDVPANLANIRRVVMAARDSGAELVVFPEMADTGYTMDAIKTHAASWKKGAVPELQEMAREAKVQIVCGVSEREENQIYNSQVVIGPAGQIITRYRKTHLFGGTTLPETECFGRGDEMVEFALGEFRF